MKHTTVHFESHPEGLNRFRTGVSLHGHTLHSREALRFVYRLAKKHKYVRVGLGRGEARYLRANGTELDLGRAWWTPPAAPLDAWALEKNHIENGFNLQALVSLSDHDNIEAPLSLRLLDQCKEVPISVEWTVPFGPTFFHLGIHNLPPDRARELMDEFSRFTLTRGKVCQSTPKLADLLQTLNESRETLIVFNHPCWDENGIGQVQHMEWMGRFFAGYGRYFHALELNGLRPWPENRQVLRMARDLRMPIVSGGDRHALEPNTMLDLTNASSFSEYVEQVRSGVTDVFVTNQYREPFQLRVIQVLSEIMQNHENHGRGWRLWSDRVFYRCDDGVVRSLTTLFSNYTPVAIDLFVRGISLVRHRSVLNTFRIAFPRNQELAL